MNRTRKIWKSFKLFCRSLRCVCVYNDTPWFINRKCYGTIRFFFFLLFGSADDGIRRSVKPNIKKKRISSSILFYFLFSTDGVNNYSGKTVVYWFIRHAAADIKKKEKQFFKFFFFLRFISGALPVCVFSSKGLVVFILKKGARTQIGKKVVWNLWEKEIWPSERCTESIQCESWGKDGRWFTTADEILFL